MNPRRSARKYAATKIICHRSPDHDDNPRLLERSLDLLRIWPNKSEAATRLHISNI
jgi:hypothetical protein